MFHPVDALSNHSTAAKRSVYAMACAYSVFNAGFNFMGFLKILLLILGVLLGYPTISLSIIDYVSVMNVISATENPTNSSKGKGVYEYSTSRNSSQEEFANDRRHDQENLTNAINRRRGLENFSKGAVAYWSCSGHRSDD